MERKIIVLFVSLAVIAGFFFPFFYLGSFELSGPNYILSAHTPSFKYLLLFIPLASVFIFLETWYKEALVFKKNLLYWLPLFSLILVFTLISVSVGVSNVLSDVGVGFWMILVFSIGLALFPNKRKMRTSGVS